MQRDHHTLPSSVYTDISCACSLVLCDDSFVLSLQDEAYCGTILVQRGDFIVPCALYMHAHCLCIFIGTVESFHISTSFFVPCSHDMLNMHNVFL